MTDDTIATSVGNIDRLQLEKRGLAGVDLVARITNADAPIEAKLKAFIQLGGELKECGRPADALAAFRMARRAAPKGFPFEKEISELGRNNRSARVADFIDTDDFRFLTLEDAGDSFYGLMQVRDDFYFSPNFIQYISAALNGYHDNVSFCFWDKKNDRPAVVVPCTIFPNGKLQWMNQPLKLYFTRDEYRTSKLISLAVDQLLFIARSYGTTGIYIGEDVSLLASPIFRNISTFPVLHELLNRSVIDLTLGDDTISAGIRRSYKSLINNGLKELTFSFYQNETVTDDVVKNLNVRLCEIRETEPGQQHLVKQHQNEFAACVDLCRRGFGEIETACAADGSLVGVTVIIDDGASAYYAIGAYAAPSIHKQSHAMLYQAILRAKRRGISRFLVSTYTHPTVSVDRVAAQGIAVIPEKIRNMNWFKSGFTDTIELMQAYRIFL